MSTTFNRHAMTSTPSAAGRTALLVGLAAAAVAMAATAWGAHGLRDLAILTITLTVATVGVFGFVVPRALRRHGAGGTALWLSVPAVLILLPLYWSGLPMVLGSAGMLVGYQRRYDGTGRAKAVAGLVLGGLAVLGYAAIYLIDGLLLGNI